MLTRLAEFSLPVHVLMHYAGHATPSMRMHYIAARQERPPRHNDPTTVLGHRLPLTRGRVSRRGPADC